MTPEIFRRSAIRAAIITAAVMAYWLWSEQTDSQAGATAIQTAQGAITPLSGERTSPLTFTDNPYPQIPAQCYIETATGRQNACLFCHTNGLYHLGFGNNNPQAGADPATNFQLEYAFAPYSDTAPLATINRWENTLYPEKLAAHVAALGINPAQWDMQDYIRQDNWQAAYDQRPSHGAEWDAGGDGPFRLLPALNPAHLPADAQDGFVRSTSAQGTLFKDQHGYNTGWRAINFMPYGIFTPNTGSVSGIYIRLPVRFMQRADGHFDLDTYQRNLDLLHRAITNQLEGTPSHYLGKAGDESVQPGVYPVGTEFAHPLHYVDVDADGTRPDISRFPGTRSQRVKEVRYMIKWRPYDPRQFRPGDGEGGESILGSDRQGWVDNGVGWYLAGFIEDAQGSLRPQTRQELTQCIGCHSGIMKTETPTFLSGSGNTIDSTWAFPRKLSGSTGWQEMNYLGYQASTSATERELPGQATLAEPRNRYAAQGELGLFLNHVVGGNLYGIMPAHMDAFLQQHLTRSRGYGADWEPLSSSSAAEHERTSALRQQLLRDMVAKGDYLTSKGAPLAALLYPPRATALAGATRYRQVVASQRYHLGKDVFEHTPLTFRHLRSPDQAEHKLDGTPYAFGEIITERPVDTSNPALDTYRTGISATGIDADKPFAQGGSYLPEYVPIME